MEFRMVEVDAKRFVESLDVDPRLMLKTRREELKNVIKLQPKKAQHADVFAATSGHELMATLATSKDGRASLLLAGVDHLMSVTLCTGDVVENSDPAERMVSVNIELTDWLKDFSADGYTTAAEGLLAVLKPLVEHLEGEIAQAE